jgi:septum formation protein
MPAANAELILASASPRRSALLAQIGVAHRALPAAIDEAPAAAEAPEACVRRLAALKAAQVQSRLRAQGGELPAVLGADTAVVLGAQMLGKPRDRAHALTMLTQLSGRTHRVLCAVTLLAADGARSALSDSEVRFRELRPAECAAYWDSGEPQDKAGGYAIQGLGALFIAELRGSYSGVVGLPLLETAQLLRAAGISCWHGNWR